MNAGDENCNGGNAVPAARNIDNLLLARLGDNRPALMYEDDVWSWDEHIQECMVRSAWLDSIRVDGPFHVGVLLDNVPDYSFLLGAVALNGGVVVGINPTRRGAELQRDIRNSHCQVIVTETRYLSYLVDLDLPVSPDRIFNIDESSYCGVLDQFRGARMPMFAGADPGDLMMLIFTSGTSGEPKAVRVTHRKIAGPGIALAQRGTIQRDDIVYASMPMFHSACIMAAWAPALAAGATIVMRRRFSASGFLPDVRRYGVTFFHYVGKPLAYILATPEQLDDADNTLRVANGNEATHLDIGRFEKRFGCEVFDGFGSTEGGVYVTRTPDTPTGSIGVAGDGVDILNQNSMEPVPPGQFDAEGRLTNPEEAIGELVNIRGSGAFEGYYNNIDADVERMRNGMYWSGDLAYRDSNGFVFFAGRITEWLRVDGENFAAAPVERILIRFPAASQVVVYAVPSSDVGDDVMVTLKCRDGCSFDPAAFVEFIQIQRDLSPKWIPKFIRVTETLPETQTNKVMKRVLARDGWLVNDQVWWCPDRSELSYRELTPQDEVELIEAFRQQGRSHLLPATRG